MKGRFLTAVLLAAGCLLPPAEAGSTGVHENAAAESAFLLAPRRVVAHAGVELGHGENLDGSVYRFYAAFPVRNTFLIAVEQPLVSVSSDSDVEAGVGDLSVRLRTRLAGERRVLWLTGSLGAGTGEKRFFPYSSESVDIALAFAVTDSLGPFHVFAAAGVVWAQRVPDELERLHDDYRRATGGLGVRFGDAAAVRAGVVLHDYAYIDVRRDIVFAAAIFRWSETLRVTVEGQVETGPEGARVSDRAGALGVAVHF